MTTNISWTDETWNPVVGCTIVSPGCTNCFAMNMARRLEAMGVDHYKGLTRMSGGRAVWTGKVAAAPDHVWEKPFKWKQSKMIFPNSMGDLFHESISFDLIDRAYAVMALTPQHIYQPLTKRSTRMMHYMTMDRRDEINSHAGTMMDYERMPSIENWPPKNIWHGVSIEDQPTADERIPDLLATPSSVRWISAEPLLSNLDLSKWINVEGQRTRILGSGGAGALLSEPRQRNDSSSGRMEGWRQTVSSHGQAEASRPLTFEGGGVSKGDVPLKERTQERLRASHNLDGEQSAPHPIGDGSKSQGWRQAEQCHPESGSGDTARERASQSPNTFSEEKDAERREEFDGGFDGREGFEDACALAGGRNDPKRDSRNIQGISADSQQRHDGADLEAPSLDWVVVGGESGPNARPMNPDWVIDLEDQCSRAGIPFHLKQWGEWIAYEHFGASGWDFTREKDGKRFGRLSFVEFEDPAPSSKEYETRYPWGSPGPCMVRVGKKAAGRKLFGKVYDAYPERFPG